MIVTQSQPAICTPVRGLLLALVVATKDRYQAQRTAVPAAIASLFPGIDEALASNDDERMTEMLAALDYIVEEVTRHEQQERYVRRILQESSLHVLWPEMEEARP